MRLALIATLVATYTASMSVLHTDGHVMNKSWTFKLK